ncbi:MAG: hypothetical protein AAF636_18505 [Pseudomonadota bacterium]
MTILLNRTDVGTEIYFSSDAETMLRAFGAPEGLIPQRGAFIDYVAFQDGTWGIGDRLLEQVRLEIDGSPAAFEAMSFMLHPTEEAIDLRDPVDGMIAIGVCNVIPETARVALESVQSYVGYFAHEDSRGSVIELSFPPTSDLALTVKVRDFVSGSPDKAYAVQFNPGDRIHLRLLPERPVLRESILYRHSLLVASLLLSMSLTSIFYQKWRRRLFKRAPFTLQIFGHSPWERSEN